jgi:Zn-dependent peptidase ImmA (M78 family)/transcriptional regulator with XRE-family HTH domain
MAKSVEAIVAPELLVWARERAGLEIRVAAKKGQIEPERLASWERGEGRPTIAQLRRLGRVYKRPLAVFYLPRPPKGFDPLHDFRRLPGSRVRGQSPELVYEIRRAQERRDLALELYGTTEGDLPPFGIGGSTRGDPEELAAAIREFLGINYDEQVMWSSVTRAFRRWRAALESRLVLVFQAPRISPTEMRGFSISETPMPVVVLNSKDSVGARIFTMLHELCHVVIRNGGVCDLGSDRTEVFCNHVAGAALVPAEYLLREPLVGQARKKDGWTDADLRALATRYGVSREVILRRLLVLGRTTEAFYRRRRDKWQAEFDALDKRSTGGPAPHVLAVSRAGPLFVRLVLANYRQENITASDVADFLAVKLKHLPKIESEVSGPTGGVAA